MSFRNIYIYAVVLYKVSVPSKVLSSLASLCLQDDMMLNKMPRLLNYLVFDAEATLMKLKLGSQRDQSSPFEETVEMESESSTTSASSFVESNNTSTTALKSLQHVITSPDEEVMTIDSDSSSSNDQLSFSAMQSTGDSKDQRSRNVSVLYLFSKYNYSRQALTPSGEAMLIASSCSASTYASSSISQSLGISKEQSEHERLSSSSACQM